MISRYIRFPGLPEIKAARYYGVIWSEQVTSNGNPWIVRKCVLRREPQRLAEFDAWVADVAGWPVDWPLKSQMPRTNWDRTGARSAD